MEHFKKEEVLDRPELPMDKDIDPKHFRYEGEYPKNQFWGSDARCYVPVIYKAQAYKLRVRIKRGGSER